MTVLEFLMVAIPSVFISALVSFLILKFRKDKTPTVGDLHIFPDEDGLTACYVAWKTEPSNLIGEEYVLLKVIKSKDSQE